MNLTHPLSHTTAITPGMSQSPGIARTTTGVRRPITALNTTGMTGLGMSGVIGQVLMVLPLLHLAKLKQLRLLLLSFRLLIPLRCLMETRTTESLSLKRAKERASNMANTKAESPLGAQLDSLTDFVNFGIAPVLLVYLWALQSTGRLGWAIILVYSVCCALRLARFNVDMEEADRPAWKTRYFIGVPSPSAGGLVMLPIYLQVAGIIDLAAYPSIILVNTILVGLLMVSTLPTFSGKGLTHIRRDLVLPLMLFIGSMAVMLFTFPWLTLTAMSIAYYAVLPISAYTYWRLKQG